jgi:hypothetical protein
MLLTKTTSVASAGLSYRDIQSTEDEGKERLKDINDFELSCKDRYVVIWRFLFLLYEYNI